VLVFLEKIGRESLASSAGIVKIYQCLLSKKYSIKNNARLQFTLEVIKKTLSLI